MDDLLGLVPEPVRPLFARLFSKEALFAKNKAEWDGRYADLVGRELEWGDSFHWTSEFMSPAGIYATYQGTTVVAEVFEREHRQCCRLRYAYGSKLEGASKLVERLFEGLDVRGEMKEWDLAGAGERIVEPATMMIHSEETWRSGKAMLTFNAVSGLTRFDETRTWIYEYGI
jgi:hypothetical protein